MILLAGFLEIMFRAILFVGMAMAVGGVVFRWCVLPALAGSVATATALKRAAGLASSGAGMMLACQLLILIITPWSLANDKGQWPLAAFLSTRYAQASLLRAGTELLFLGLLLSLWIWPERHGQRARWTVATILATAVMATGAWLTHGVSRLHNAPSLMTLTVIHQFAAAVWIGGAIHLTRLWRVLRDAGRTTDLWPLCLVRFSKTAMASVALLLAVGAALFWPYVHGWGPLIGTAYGTMLLTKVVLTGFLLILGALNFQAIRDWQSTRAVSALVRRVPVLVETEAAIGIIILMAAAAFTGQPPAADVADRRASSSEIAWVFAPKWPQLTVPPWKPMIASSSSVLNLYAIPSRLESVQSNFNHNWAGIFVILVGLGALAHRITGSPRLRHWPLLFLPLGLFLMIFNEPTVWPLGPESFWKTMIAPEAFVHRFAVLLVFALALLQWRTQTSPQAANSRWRYVFPMLLFVGGAMLLAHSHTVFVVKWAFLIEVSHNAIGILAVLAGATSWLELRLDGPERRAASIIWPICFTLVGVVLLFYRETVFAIS